jgi:hypothetical protein
MFAHPHRTRTTKLRIKPSVVLFWSTRPIWIIDRGCIHTAQHYRCQYSPDESTSSWRHMCVFIEREHSQNIIVLVNWFAKIPPLLLVPPICVRVSKLSLDHGRVEVPAVLASPGQQHSVQPSRSTYHFWVVIFRICFCQKLSWSLWRQLDVSSRCASCGGEGSYGSGSSEGCYRSGRPHCGRQKSSREHCRRAEDCARQCELSRVVYQLSA